MISSKLYLSQSRVVILPFEAGRQNLPADEICLSMRQAGRICLFASICLMQKRQAGQGIEWCRAKTSNFSVDNFILPVQIPQLLIIILISNDENSSLMFNFLTLFELFIQFKINSNLFDSKYLCKNVKYCIQKVFNFRNSKKSILNKIVHTIYNM